MRIIINPILFPPQFPLNNENMGMWIQNLFGNSPINSTDSKNEFSENAHTVVGS
jgi:hypothetical protein